MSYLRVAFIFKILNVIFLFTYCVVQTWGSQRQMQNDLHNLNIIRLIETKILKNSNYLKNTLLGRRVIENRRL